jgi:hypothetical protein
MRQSIDITKGEKDSMIGIKMNDTNYFNPVLRENGNWCISIQSRDMIINPDFEYLKSRIDESYRNISEAEDLSDVFNSENLEDSDCDNIISQLSEHNSLIRKDIRFRGVKSSTESLEAKEVLMGEGSILLYSK